MGASKKVRENRLRWYGNMMRRNDKHLVEGRKDQAQRKAKTMMEGMFKTRYL